MRMFHFVTSSFYSNYRRLLHPGIRLTDEGLIPKLHTEKCNLILRREWRAQSLSLCMGRISVLKI